MSDSSANTEIFRLQNIANIFDGYVMLCLVIIGTIGNIINIFVFLRHKSLRQMSNSVFLIGLFIGSLVLFWSSRIPRCILTITGVNVLVGSIAYCKIRWLFGRWGLNMPFTCLCLSSIDRFLSTSRNARFRRMMTRKRAIIILVTCSIGYLVIFFPDAIYYSGYSCKASVSARAQYANFITYFNLCITNILSMVILGVFSVLTWHNLHITQHIRYTQLQQQVNRMMLIEFIMAFITTLPNFVYNIYQQITQNVVKSQLRMTQETLWTNINVCVSFTMHVGTFYVYMIVSREYRRHTRTAFSFRKRNQIGTEHISPRNQNTTSRRT